jgi:hypothetical protein
MIHKTRAFAQVPACLFHLNRIRTLLPSKKQIQFQEWQMEKIVKLLRTASCDTEVDIKALVHILRESNVDLFLQWSVVSLPIPKHSTVVLV